jgi:hypothetical protein
MTGVTNERYLHKDLNAILKRLGTTKSHLLLFTAGPGDATALVPAVSTAAVLYQTKDETGTVNVNAEFGPLPLPCGLWAYHFGVVGNNHIAASADSTEHSYGDGSADEAFSLGAWILPSTKSDNTLIAKFDGAAEEFKWGLAATTGALYLELHDASASETEIGTADGSQTKGAYDGSPALHEWSFVVTTYDGAQGAPTIRHYINGVDVSNANADSVESGPYTAMENTATPLLFAASDLTASPAEEYHGHMALPFITGKELSATEVLELYNITRSMILGK